MPPKRQSQRKVAQMRKRFREAIDWGFDGNLSMASRVLQMPLSTVQQYYEQGPRRISKMTLARLDDILGLGQWINGTAIDPATEKEPTAIQQATTWGGIRPTDGRGPTYHVPNVVKWRIDRIIKHMAKVSGSGDPMEHLGTFYSPVLEAIEDGLLGNPDAPQGMPAMPGGTPQYGELKPGGDGFSIVHMDISRAQQVHRLCEFWESLLKMERP